MTNPDETRLLPAVAERLKKYRDWPVIKEARELLAQKLPAKLCYHSAAHTDDVMHEAILFGLYDKLSEREIEILAVAAAYHDLGFIESSVEHEARGALLVDSALRQHGGFSSDEAGLIRQMILDTKLVVSEDGVAQCANTDLSKYLLDADLSNLGRLDFFDKLELVRKELGVEKRTFAAGTLSLITRHTWHTAAGAALRLEREVQNIKELRSLAA